MIYTKGEAKRETMDIWAIPRQVRYYSQEEIRQEPFEYSLRRVGDSPWADGAVKVNTIEVDYTIPAGINLLQKAIETLEEQKRKSYEDHLDNVRKLDEQINQLKLLAPPQAEDGSIEGELV